MLESSPSVTRTYRLEPRSRLTIWANAVPGAAPRCAGRRDSGLAPDHGRAGHVSPAQLVGRAMAAAGATTISPVWYFAEGATGRFFDCFILIVNPNPVPAEIEARFARPDGQVVTRTYTVLPERRLTIWVDSGRSAARADRGRDHPDRRPMASASSAERAMWWPDGAWYEGHVSLASLRDQRTLGHPRRIRRRTVGQPDLRAREQRGLGRRDGRS